MAAPYIVFAGQCRQAMDFYQEVFGTTVQVMMLYNDYMPPGLQTPPEDMKNWVLHAEMEINGTSFWFADEAVQPVVKDGMVKINVVTETADEARAIFAGLGDGAMAITLPPTETFYSAFHAGLTDRFGVGWGIVTKQPPANRPNIPPVSH